jgi:hypothetical protein
MARQHVMTPARKAALRKAQLASAAKRRKTHPNPSAPQTKPTALHSNRKRVNRKRAAIVGAVGAGFVTASAVGYSQAHSPRSYTRTAIARQHYRRTFRAMHRSLGDDPRQTKCNARRVAASKFLQGIDSPRNTAAAASHLRHAGGWGGAPEIQAAQGYWTKTDTVMARNHVMTPARAAALRKAQLAPAKARHRTARKQVGIAKSVRRTTRKQVRTVRAANRRRTARDDKEHITHGKETDGSAEAIRSSRADQKQVECDWSGRCQYQETEAQNSAEGLIVPAKKPASKARPRHGQKATGQNGTDPGSCRRGCAASGPNQGQPRR